MFVLRCTLVLVEGCFVLICTSIELKWQWNHSFGCDQVCVCVSLQTGGGSWRKAGYLWGNSANESSRKAYIYGMCVFVYVCDQMCIRGHSLGLGLWGGVDIWTHVVSSVMLSGFHWVWRRIFYTYLTLSNCHSIKCTTHAHYRTSTFSTFNWKALR